jgi:uncharacterized protein
MKHKNLLCGLLFALIVLAGCKPVTAPQSEAPSALARQTVTARHAALAGTAGPFHATERVLDFQNEGQKVVGTLTLPQGDGVTAPYPVVLIFPGLTNSRDSLPISGTHESLYGRTARVLAEHGIASLRIDFRGSGDSQGAWSDTTFSGQISDALAAINRLATLPEIDTTRMGFIGLSQGGLVAAEAAARDPRVDSVVLWSPVSNPPDTYQLLMGADTVAAGLTAADPGVHVVLPWGAAFEMKRGFFQDLYAINPIGAISRVKAPLLVVVGLRDGTVTPQPYQGQTYLNYHEGPELLVVLDSDHVFSVLTDAGPTILDDAVAWSLAWLESSLR